MKDRPSERGKGPRPTRLGTISTPLLWEEVVDGVNPDDFHVRFFRKRL